MRGWRQPPNDNPESAPRGFDDFDLRLGDVMRGERATMGRSLLDVQRELKIKATYIAAIENADISAFEAPGFVAGYVRSYARYLGLDPEWAFETFCAEAGFVPASGLGPAPRTAGSGGSSKPGGAKAAGTVRGPVFRSDAPDARRRAEGERDPIAQPRVSFAPAAPGPFSGFEPRAIGPTLVLLALIGGLGYGGWSILKEVQRVTVAPVERAPEAVAQVDPLDGVVFEGETGMAAGPGLSGASSEAIDRLYRPRPLDTPRMVPRDGPIAQLDPRAVGTFAGLAEPAGTGAGPDPQGRTVASQDSGPPDPFAGGIAAALTALQDPPGVQGPVQPDASAAPGPGSDLAQLGLGGALGPGLGIADGPFAAQPAASAREAGSALGTDAAGSDGVQPRALIGAPRVTESVPNVVLVAVEAAWVRVRAADGSVLFERTMQQGDSWVVPPSDSPPTLRTGAAGAVFFAVNGQTYGPAGAAGAVVDGIALAADPLAASFAQVDPAADATAREAVAVAEAALGRLAAPQPPGAD